MDVGKKYNDTHVIIMAGGSGTRFWPKSRINKPKQLLSLWDEQTLIEHTLSRFQPRISQENIWIVTTETLTAATKEITEKKFPRIRFLSEPSAKNTAACIYWGIREIKKINPDAVIAVMPADHYIGDPEAYFSAIEKAICCARENGGLVTLGIKPNRPETGFGYIEFGKSMELNTLRVQNFVEKPDLRTALRYVESGHYLWNAGMFIFTAKEGDRAFSKCMPSLVKTFETHQDIREIYKNISKADAVSVDYGVMESAEKQGISVWVIPVDCGWNDVGSFTALEEIQTSVKPQVISLDAPCNLVQSDRGIVALLGVNDLVVVRDGDVVLVCAKDRAQDIKLLLEKVRPQHPNLL